MTPTHDMPFWSHVEVLRGVLWRSLIAVTLCTVALFLLKEPLFRLILAPARSADPGPLHLISTELAGQFQAHLTVALQGGIALATPYILWQLFGFVAPALYARERHFARLILPITYLLFVVGVIFNYTLLFPVALRFLATYQVSPEVQNTITLSSYISTLTTMTLALGLIFELPVALWLMGRCGLVTAPLLRRYRRHALIVLLVLAALVTPPDAFTMLLVSLPLYALYEVGIWVVRR